MVAASSNFSLTQEKYDHLVSLLQQANLLSLASPPCGPVSNHINTSSSLGHHLVMLLSHVSMVLFHVLFKQILSIDF